MVAITVVMAAIVSSWSAGVKAPTAPTTVGLDINRQNTNITTVVTAIDPASGEPLHTITLTYKEWNGTGYNTTSFNQSTIGVGYSHTVDTNITEPSQFIVKVKFKDLSSKVLYARDT
ncbi:MAG: hypothetical protein KKI06_08575 [Euryarchaeota archaeon]|nr:hypothetical protein [Euryarchaeota archaeon]